MLLAPSVVALFKWRQFEPEMILLAVGWYLRFSLSYRDVEELLAERGLHADHVTVWVQRYGPEIQRRLRPRLRPTNDRATRCQHDQKAPPRSTQAPRNQTIAR
jgi:transposase-like protein